MTSRRVEVFEDLAGVRQRAPEAVELGDDERVASAAGGERLAQARTLPVGAGETAVDVDPLSRHPERR
ncbi:MAG TPA: hypothetical protein VGV57_06575, partial [Thermoleophilaceae bacterium]|nr:hypothetical protein [Thermoleophilaceae bacterium]